MEHLVGPALFDLVRPNVVGDLVHYVAEVERIDHAHAEIHGELEPRFAGRGLDAVVLLEKQHAEAIEARILERQPILGLIHAEAAGTARAGGEEDVVVDDLLLRLAGGLQIFQILDEVAPGEVRRIALSVVAVLLAELKARNIGHGEDLALVSAAMEDRLNHLFVFPGEAAEENGDRAALLGQKRALDGAREVRAALSAQPALAEQALAFGGYELENFFFRTLPELIERYIDTRGCHTNRLFLRSFRWK